MSLLSPGYLRVHLFLVDLFSEMYGMSLTTAGQMKNHILWVLTPCHNIVHKPPTNIMFQTGFGSTGDHHQRGDGGWVSTSQCREILSGWAVKWLHTYSLGQWVSSLDKAEIQTWKCGNAGAHLHVKISSEEPCLQLSVGSAPFIGFKVSWDSCHFILKYLN